MITMGLSEPSFSANIFHKDECLFLNLAGLSGPFLLCERFSAKMVPLLKPSGLKWTRTTDLTLIRRAL